MARGFERRQRAAVGSAAAAFFFMTNASRKVTLALDGSRSTTFIFLSLALPVFLIAVAPGFLPEPARRPPEQPGLPAPRVGAEADDLSKRRRCHPKKDVGHSDLFKEWRASHQKRI